VQLCFGMPVTSCIPVTFCVCLQFLSSYQKLIPACQHLLVCPQLLLARHPLLAAHSHAYSLFAVHSRVCFTFCVVYFLPLLSSTLNWFNALTGCPFYLSLTLHTFPQELKQSMAHPGITRRFSAVSHPSLQSCALVATDGSWGNTTDSALRAQSHPARYNPHPLLCHHHVLHWEHCFRWQHAWVSNYWLFSLFATGLTAISGMASSLSQQIVWHQHIPVQHAVFIFYTAALTPCCSCSVHSKTRHQCAFL
jgi:hypothetical protein